LSTALLITPVSSVLLHFSVLLAFLILFAIKEIEEESLETEKLFINKHEEILVEVQERIDGVEKEEREIQEKRKEASKDIEESKKPIAESGAEDQQKEKLQTKLEKLTAQKNAIEQKKQISNSTWNN
jgi:septal ring factor EnvC (AmiA/AmiB activator)